MVYDFGWVGEKKVMGTRKSPSPLKAPNQGMHEFLQMHTFPEL